MVGLWVDSRVGVSFCFCIYFLLDLRWDGLGGSVDIFVKEG